MRDNSSLCILGRQPSLGLAELESIFGADKLHPVGNMAAVLDVESTSIDLRRIGGSIKLCTVLGVFQTSKWTELQQLLIKELPQVISKNAQGKVQLGISTYGLAVKPQQLLATGLNLKKALRSMGRSVRLIPNQFTALNSAQVLHNHLTGQNGFELVLIRYGEQTIYAQTSEEQDIESFTVRDRGRPRRDARVGMLPPKLAQIIINLAAGDAMPASTCILDPFCGTGVILQESLLLGFNVYGTDLEQRMIDYTQANLEWLKGIFDFGGTFKLAAGDATVLRWQQPIDRVACESYLGQPFNTAPSQEKLEHVRKTCNTILEKFLSNIAAQLTLGARLCLAIPAWQQKPGSFIHLPMLDHLEKLGYNRVSFEHSQSQELVYSREGQIVARELLVITRK